MNLFDQHTCLLRVSFIYIITSSRAEGTIIEPASDIMKSPRGWLPQPDDGLTDEMLSGGGRFTSSRPFHPTLAGVARQLCTDLVCVPHLSSIRRYHLVLPVSLLRWILYHVTEIAGIVSHSCIDIFLAEELLHDLVALFLHI